MNLTNCILSNFVFFFVMLGGTLIPFLVGWTIKRKCPNRAVVFRFISRKWIVTLVPVALVSYLIIKDGMQEPLELKKLLFIWAILSSAVFVLGDHISQLVRALVGIKFGSMEIAFEKDSNKINLKEKKNDVETDSNYGNGDFNTPSTS